jgi:phosphoribosyl 1,2-cyclic phosphodiesterase
MGLRFTVLASGSGGNATLVEVDGFGVLIDAGLGPRQLAGRLASAGRAWADVNAVLLTHTHSDHWRDRTLALLHRYRIPLYCHLDHHRGLRAYSPTFPALLAAGLVRPFEPGQDIELSPNLRCQALPVRHDGGATFGFRLDGGATNLFGDTASVGYVADLGTWDLALAERLANVDLLAVEFNHDVAMEHASGRSSLLIERVLGDHGHLSNAQASELVQAVLQRSEAGRLRHVVQLHLSRDCNRPLLAREAARAALAVMRAEVALHTARQDEPLPTLTLGEVNDLRRRRRAPRRSGRGPTAAQPWLPGFESEESSAV